nr:GTPase HflX [Peptostreptococcus faecalis]
MKNMLNDLSVNNHKIDNEPEKALCVGLNITSNKNSSDVNIEDSMAELKELVLAAGAEVVGEVIQNRSYIETSTYLGSGKIEEIKIYAESLDATMIVFNDELSGAQIRNIENIIGKKIIDRTILILDIFAQRALSKEGKLQVELAQLKYRLPRLYGMGGQMSRTGAGIGTRGPGEQKLEKDKRHILNRAAVIRKELKQVVKNRDIQRSQRSKNKIPIVALVGYTNAGKSTILNEIIKTHPDYEREKEVFTKDMLFATLDVTLRKASLPNKKEFLIVDTVGFVSKLPHDLIDAFKATLEEVLYADLILHVIDSTNSSSNIQKTTTESVLKDLGADDKKTITVYNKIDKLDLDIYPKNHDDLVYISAKKGINMDKLMNLIQNCLMENTYKVNLLLPFDKGNIFNLIKEKYHIDEFEYTEKGIDLVVSLDEEDYNLYKEYIKIK